MQLPKKIPPWDREAEWAIIGAILIDNNNIEKVVDVVQASDFYLLDHQILMKGVFDLYQKNIPVDYITLSDWVKGNEKYNKTFTQPPVSYCLELVEKTISSAFLSDYANIVKSKSILRSLIGTCSDTIEKSYTVDSWEIEEFLSQVDGNIGEVLSGGKPNDVPHISETVQKYIPQLENIIENPQIITGIGSGFVDLDKVLGGFQETDLIILAGRPGLGKSSAGIQFAYNAAKEGKGTVYFSLEMSSLQLTQRLISSEARIDSQKLKNGNLTQLELDRIIIHAGKISESSLYIEERAVHSPLDLRLKLKKLIKEKGVKLAVVDYLQLMNSPEKDNNRVLEIADITRKIKLMAKEFSIPIILLSQLNREVEKRVDKRPQLGDLRDSGAIEADADVVLFIYRDDFYNKLSPEQGIAEFIVGKNRNGPTPTIKLKWWKEYTRFDNLILEV